MSGAQRPASSFIAAQAVLLLVSLSGWAIADDSSPTVVASAPAAATEATFVEATIRLAGPSVGTFNASQQPMLIRRERGNPSSSCQSLATIASQRPSLAGCLGV